MANRIVLAVIIVNYRTAHLVIDCVQSLLPEISEIDARIIIVDNQSGDDSVSRIQTWLEEQGLPSSLVLLLESPGNLGFSGGNNVGIRAVSAEYYLLLNSDTIVHPGAIRILLETAAKFPKAGIVSPRLLGASGEIQMSCFKFHRPLGELVDSAQTSIIDRLMQDFVIRLPPTMDVMEPEWTSFACALVRRQVFEEVGLLDDEFFMYFEDVEFCYRTRKAGWTIVHNPAAEVVHFHGGSSSFEESVRARKRLPKYYYESRTRYFHTLFGWGGLLIANMSCVSGLGIALLRKWLQGKITGNPEFKGTDIWLNFLSPNKKSSMLP
ncbi:MAG: glycosyltransferase family 2 protein [Burkholderiales bacterium]|nr:glycosyltransferase family 2 protein [Burkholderiales bacterium]